MLFADSMSAENRLLKVSNQECQNGPRRKTPHLEFGKWKIFTYIVKQFINILFVIFQSAIFLSLEHEINPFYSTDF